MPISSLIVGVSPCSISKVISTLRSSTSFPLFHDKFTDISIDLDTPMELTKKLKVDFLLDKLTLGGVVSSLVEDWVGRNGSGANLQELVGILKENNLTDCAESLENAFTSQPSIPAEYRKYSRLPPGVQDFSSEANKPKSICIIYSPDQSITCEKLCENLDDFSSLEYEDFLKVISAKEIVKGQELFYYMTLSSLRHIKKVLTEVLAERGKKIRLVVVTGKDNEERLGDLLQAHNDWQGHVQTCDDQMDWNDLTPAHQHDIENKLKKRFHIELNDEELNDGLCGQVLIDMINGTDLNLFKDRFPEKLGYYVHRTILTRHYISFKIFERSTPNILLFTGMKRYELSIHVKTDGTDVSSAQIRQKELDVKHIILEDPSHFEKICEKTNKPVHLLHYDNGRLQWVRSRGGMDVLQRNVDEFQDRWREDLICRKIVSDFNFPIVVTDSPGMGKTVLIAQIGTMLTELFPERKVFFLPLTEFIQQVKGSGHGDKISAIQACLQNMICENVVGKAALNSKLNANVGILIELLMDGFDELNSGDTQLALEILQTIRSSFKSTRLWITSRSQYLNALENALETLGYNIQPFDENDQIQFLTSYWSREQQLNQVNLTKYAKECLKILKSNMNAKLHDIAEIPLQCLLIGEVHEEDAVTYANSNQTTFPAIFIDSIGNLYKAMIAKKFKKYFDLQTKGTTVDMDTAADTLLKMHARLSLELIFPEHFEKLNNLFGPVKIEDLLKVGIVEAPSISTTPRFIHRTFAEYFVAWFFVNGMGTPGIMDKLFAGVFTCHEAFSNDDIDSFVFAYPVVCYFIDSLITDASPVEIDSAQGFTPDYTDAPESEIRQRQMAHACVNADLIQLFNFFLRINMFESNEQSVFNRELFLLAVQNSSSKLVKQVLALLEKFHKFDSPLQTFSLSEAVRRGEFSIFEYMINGRQLGLMLEGKQMPPEVRTILHDCVEDTRNNFTREIEQKIDMIQMIIKINPKLLEEKNKEGQTPLLSKNVHVRLILKLIHLGSNLLAKDINNHTLIHLYYGGRNLTPDDYNSILSNIPECKLKILVQMNGKYGTTPLASILKVIDPTPETLQQFMEVGADFRCEDETGTSAWEIAINSGRSGSTLSKLMEYGATAISLRNGKGGSPLHTAAWLGNPDAAALFLSDKYKIDVNIKDRDGFTSLDYVLQSDFKHGKLLQTAMVIHEATGKFTEVVNTAGETWFHVYTQNGNIQSIHILIRIGADINAVDEEGNTPTHLVMKKWEKSKTQMLELLLEHGGNPNLLNKNGETPFHIALMSNELDMETFKLLKSKTSIKWTSSLATRALLLLITDGNHLDDEEFNAFATELENHGADFNIRYDANGNSLLHAAVNKCDLRTIQLLLQNQKDGNVMNYLEQLPFHLVEYEDDGMSWEVIKLLIASGVDAHAKDSNNNTFLHAIISRCYALDEIHSLTEYLVAKKLEGLFNINGGDKGATPFQLAVYKLDLEEETLSLLHSVGINFNAVDNSGESVLGYAVRGKRSVEFICSLIRYGADWKCTNHKCSMLHFSAEAGTIDDLKLFPFLEEIQVNGIDGNGDTPIHCSVLQVREEGVLEKCNILMENGADVNILNAKGLTPLGLAQIKRDDDVPEKFRSVITEHNRQHPGSSASKDEDRNAIDLVTLKCSIESGADVSAKDEQKYSILYNFFVLRSSTPTSAEFHTVCEYLVANNLTDLLNFPSGKFGSSPFQEAVMYHEPTMTTLTLLRSNYINFNAIDKEGDSVLFYAVRGKRSLEFLSSLIAEHGADIGHLNNKKENLLHYAVKYGTDETLKFLLDFGTLDVNQKDVSGCTPLHRFVWSCSCELIMSEGFTKYVSLVSHGADLNSKDIWGNAPLHSSTINRRKHVSLKLIKQLIENGADINAKDLSRYTFLHSYIINEPRPTPSEFLDMVEYLYEKGCIDIFNEGNVNETTPILYAVKYLEPDEKTLLRLFSCGINFNTIDKCGDTILSYAICGKRSAQFISALITRFGVQTKKLNKNGEGLLHLVTLNYCANTLESFLKLALPDLDVNETTKNGDTPLHYAVCYSNEDAFAKCKLLVNYGSDVTSKNKRERTPLREAAFGVAPDVTLIIMKYLIEQGADAYAKDDEDHTFLGVFLRTGITSSSKLHSLVEYLISKNFSGLFNIPEGKLRQTPLQLLLRYMEPELKTLSLLKSRGVDFNTVDKIGCSVLVSATCKMRSIDLLSSLIFRFGVDYKCLNCEGESILHTAAFFGTVDALKLFVDFGDLDINALDNRVRTPLMFAVHPESEGIDVLQKCKLLVGKGADVSIKNKKGQTALKIVQKSYEGPDEDELVALLQLPKHDDDEISKPPQDTAPDADTQS